MFMCEKKCLDENKCSDCKCNDEKCCKPCCKKECCCAKMVALTIIVSTCMAVAVVKCWGASFIKNDISKEMIKERVLVQMVKNEVKRDLMMDKMRFNSFKYQTNTNSISSCPMCGKK